MNTPHTPTPWTLVDDGRSFQIAEVPEIKWPHDFSTDKDDDAELRQGEGFQRQLADAKFIEQACNSHEALLEALEGLTFAVSDGLRRLHEGEIIGAFAGLEPRLDAARDAIKLARGEA